MAEPKQFFETIDPDSEEGKAIIEERREKGCLPVLDPCDPAQMEYFSKNHHRSWTPLQSIGHELGNAAARFDALCYTPDRPVLMEEFKTHMSRALMLVILAEKMEAAAKEKEEAEKKAEEEATKSLRGQ